MRLRPLLPRPAAIYSGFVATVRDTNAAVSFAHTHVVAVKAPYVVTATARVHIVRQNMVLPDGSDGSATRAITWWHVYDSVERERACSPWPRAIDGNRNLMQCARKPCSGRNRRETDGYSRNL